MIILSWIKTKTPPSGQSIFLAVRSYGGMKGSPSTVTKQRPTQVFVNTRSSPRSKDTWWPCVGHEASPIVSFSHFYRRRVWIQWRIFDKLNVCSTLASLQRCWQARWTLYCLYANLILDASTKLRPASCASSWVRNFWLASWDRQSNKKPSDWLGRKHNFSDTPIERQRFNR